MTGPHTPPGAVANTHHPRSRAALSPQEVQALRSRPPEQRTALPQPGDTVGYRHEEGGAVHPAVVIEVGSVAEPGEHPDPNVWRVVTGDHRQALRDPLGRYVYELVDDPWPELVLRVGPAAPDPGQPKAWRLTTSAREARLAGACGWLPAGQIGPASEPEPPMDRPQGASGRRG